MSPQFVYTIGGALIQVFGQQSRIIDNPQISFTQAVKAGAHPEKITQLIVASDDSKPGHKAVYPARPNDLMYCDGAVLSEVGSAVVMQAGDCAFLTLFDSVTGNIAAAHAGRPALSPSGHCASCIITENALHALLGHTGDRSKVEALVTGNICGPCFKHNQGDARTFIEPFLRYPQHIFADVENGALDLYELIKHNLMFAKVLEANICHKGPCTLETADLSSHRRGDKTRNTFVVVKIK